MVLHRNTEIKLKAEICIFKFNKARSGQVPFHSQFNEKGGCLFACIGLGDNLAPLWIFFSAGRRSGFTTAK